MVETGRRQDREAPGAGYRHFKERLPEAIVVYKLVMLMLCCW